MDGTNDGAFAELPYINQVYCSGGEEMPVPAADVWYTFVAVGNRLEIQLQSALDNAVVALYEGDCAGLIGRDCTTSDDGVINTLFAPVAPGTIYYLQISGGNTTDFSNFTICLNNFDAFEQFCINGQNFFVDPPPVNGAYSPGQEVFMCLNVLGYVQNSADWLHGIVPVFGPGWDTSTVQPEPPASCSTGGEWGWYEQVAGTSSYAVANVGPEGRVFLRNHRR